MTFRIPVWLLLGFSGLAASCKNGAECLRHSDCTRLEYCDLGSCVIKSTPDSGTDDAGVQSFGGRTSSGGARSSGGSLSSAGESGNGGAGGDGGAGD